VNSITASLSLMKRHPIITYYTLVLAISWGSVLAIVGASPFLGGGTIALMNGPLLFACPSIAGILAASLIYGKSGIRDIKDRLFKWRVGARWYAVALFTAPLVLTGILYSFSLTPSIVTSSGKLSLLLSGIAVGIIVPLCEEIGWTGFATPNLRRSFGILPAGLIIGLLWGLWHYPLFSGSGSALGPVGQGVMVFVLLFSWLPAYRVLMLWVYDHTSSLLLAILMHTPIVVCQFVLIPATLSGVSMMIFDIVFGAALWFITFVLIMLDRRKTMPQLFRHQPS
jgi:uncharacterized protein